MRIWYLLFVPFLCGFQITEIMYDPEGNDNNREYIELFLNDTNVSDVFFEDLVSSDVLELVQDFSTSYVLVTEEGFNLTDLNVTVYTTGATLGNGLNNEQDLLLFRTNASILDAVFYISNRDGARNNGKSLCIEDHLLQECTPTPGIENNLNQTLNEQNYTLWISEFLPDPDGDDRAARPDGEWIELYNYGEESLDLRGLLLQDIRNTTLVISDTHLDTPLLAPQSYGVVYLNGQSLLNNQGFETIRLSTETHTIDETTYSNSKEGLSWSKDFANNMFTLSLPTPGSLHNATTVSLNSSLTLERVYVGNDDVIQFGESLRVRLRVYKGDTEKTTIKVFVGDVSKQTTVSIESKFIESVFTLTIPLVPNCKGKLKDGTYTVVAEGLDTATSLPLTIQGSSKDSCIILKQNSTVNTITVKEAAKPLKLLQPTVTTRLSDNFINGTEKIVYEASDYKARRWAVYFFCFTLVLLVGALLTRD
ncbi:MAG TPA: lamin tail domain-containing protein [Candidatus Nanoarchaeia archaeon]|nr:lamin tail domain-containing protein [Candidatus Nanoarchaeia archaeon]